MPSSSNEVTDKPDTETHSYQGGTQVGEKLDNQQRDEAINKINEAKDEEKRKKLIRNVKSFNYQDICLFISKHLFILI